MIIDTLIDKIKETENPSVVGLDTSLAHLPDDMKIGVRDTETAAAAILKFNKSLVDELVGVVPAFKVQVAYYEGLGVAGMKCFAETLKYARSKGFIVISDVKRNDIGSTAAAYSKAYLSGTEINGERFIPFESDFITVNGYLGTDGIAPFAEDCKAFDRGLFVLARTSNPSGAELQNRKLETGETVFALMGSFIEKWGAELVGKYGFSSVGAVVGATHREEAAELRKNCPHTFFLIPGYGAQGGKADDLAVCFKDGLGGIVNNSRAILTAWKKPEFAGLNFAEAAKAAAEVMREDLQKAVGLR